MSDKKKQGFHAVEANVEEMEEKIHGIERESRL